ncbi:MULTISPECIES: hypothetical protein [unclassified Streptomyces]|uniref:hypothetical protein n=1 Tax=unclassified Streptomyces TaxID=2593676 RepID=UPI002E77F16D|nr:MULTISPECIES: hypothetical protein [unclassified Streptomyces]MEE1758651.1 hypothetical protein [Streptomyces sp. SP18BB07]MEE1831055.1 hypothetical protein [Streptomyces sp. SP17KL33]
MHAPMRRRTPLPYVDEHTILVEADADEVWWALAEALDWAFSRPAAVRYAKLVGCADRTASGPRPPVEGETTFPGFRTLTAIPAERLTLLGRHRFSSYTLTFHLDAAGPDHTRLRAETRAAFPGPAGGLYRLLALGTGTHAKLTRRLLTTARLQAERPWRRAG